MPTIDDKSLGIIFTAIALMISILTTINTRKRNAALDAKAATLEAKTEAGEDTGLKMDVKYIMRGVDDIRLDQQRMRESMGQMSERITRVEESAKSFHKRLDEHLKIHPPD